MLRPRRCACGPATARQACCSSPTAIRARPTATSSAGSPGSSCGSSGARCSAAGPALHEAVARLGAARQPRGGDVRLGERARRAARADHRSHAPPGVRRQRAGAQGRPLVRGDRARARRPAGGRRRSTARRRRRCAPSTSTRGPRSAGWTRRRPSCRRVTSTRAAAPMATATSRASSWPTGRSASCGGPARTARRPASCWRATRSPTCSPASGLEAADQRQVVLGRRVGVHPEAPRRADRREDEELRGVQLALVDQDAAEAVQRRGVVGIDPQLRLEERAARPASAAGPPARGPPGSHPSGAPGRRSCGGSRRG